tara:strand:- start:573 stop:1436 length:864 start_codon:yes stop_codon:yes gene_type:complete
MEEDNMYIRKMADADMIKDLDADGRNEANEYFGEMMEIFDDMTKDKKIKFGSKDLIEEMKRLLKTGFDNTWVVRNTNKMGDLSPRTGEQKLFLNPSPKLGYASEEEAMAAVKRNNKRAGMARAKAARSIRDIQSELTEEVVLETIEDLSGQNSKLADLMDELNISFGGRYSAGTGSFKERGERLDEDLDRIMDALEQDDVTAYSQEELRKLAQFITKLHKNPNKVNFEGLEPYVRSGHREKLKEYFQIAVSKIEKSVWKAILKRNAAINLIDAFMGKMKSDTFEKDR